ncbi:unnamed protein product [Polarella glacialis]|uniref:Uncharacterized protein n=1 Tax=Polarella glacialis TaxID=89957 RepID=A0A813F9N3_POLGL|nr:unnamed protein product [Polarella glacialis]
MEFHMAVRLCRPPGVLLEPDLEPEVRMAEGSQGRLLLDKPGNYIPRAARVIPNRWVIPSQHELIFFVAATSQTDTVQVLIRWGTSLKGLAVIVNAHGKGARAVLEPKMYGEVQWGLATIPMLYAAALPNPVNGYISYEKAAWGALKVNTKFKDCLEDGTTFLKIRLEHHSPSRVARAGWWMKKATKMAGAKGYAGIDPQVLALQAQAHVAWQFACRELLLDSGWAAALRSANVGWVSLMGFESNNVFHDDFEAQGAHWHVGIDTDSSCTEGWSKRDYPPHLYFDTSGLHDVSGKRGLPFPGCNPQVVGAPGGIEVLEAFATFLRPDGGCDFCPVIALSSCLALQLLQVCQGWQANGYWAQMRLSNAVAKHENLWAVEHVGGDRFALSSCACGLYLHVGLGNSQDWAVGMSSSRSEGSLWTLEGDHLTGPIRLKSCHAGLYLHVKHSWKDLAASGREEQVFCLSPDAEHDGSRWQLQAVHAKLLPLVGSSYSVVAADTKADDGSFGLTIIKNGTPWRSVFTHDDFAKGALQWRIRWMQDGACKTGVILYDPLTGEERSSSEGLGSGSSKAPSNKAMESTEHTPRSDGITYLLSSLLAPTQFLQVRQDWQAHGNGQQMRLGSDSAKHESLWEMEYVGEGRLALRGCACGHYLHVRKTWSKIANSQDWAVFMLDKRSDSEGSGWTLEGDHLTGPIRLKSCRAGLYLHVKHSWEDLAASGREEQVFCLSSEAEHDGSNWHVMSQEVPRLSGA